MTHNISKKQLLFFKDFKISKFCKILKKILNFLTNFQNFYKFLHYKTTMKSPVTFEMLATF